MIPTFGIFLQAALLVAGICWLYGMFSKWREHLDILRTGEDNMTKGVLVGLWIITVFVGLYVTWVVIALGIRIVGGIMDLI